MIQFPSSSYKTQMNLTSRKMEFIDVVLQSIKSIAVFFLSYTQA